MAGEVRDSRTKKKRRLPIWKRLVFAGITTGVFTCVLLAALEVILYVKHPSAGFNGVLMGVRYTWGHKVVNNRYGFRERDFQVPKPEGVFRVIVLGDSLTWGAGLSEEERYSNRLETLLGAAHPGRRVEVLNFGVPGGPTIRERDILQQYVDAADPDLVIVGFCINDPQPRSQRYSAEAEKYGFLFGLLARMRYLGLSRSAVFLDRCLWSSLESTSLVPRWQDALQRVYEPDSRQWRQFVEALSEIKSTCDDRNLPPPIFAILNQGTSTTRPTDYNHPDEELKLYLRWYRQVEKAATDAGLVAVHFEQEFKRELADVPTGVNTLDGHPSAKCNDIYGRKLAGLVGPMIASPTLRLADRRERIRDERVTPAAHQQAVN